MQLALASPVDLPGVPLQARLEPQSSPAGGSDATSEAARRRLTVHLNIAAQGVTVGPGDNRIVLDCVMAARGATGNARIVGQRRLTLSPAGDDLSRLRQGGINYSATLELEAAQPAPGGARRFQRPRGQHFLRLARLTAQHGPARERVGGSLTPLHNHDKIPFESISPRY